MPRESFAGEVVSPTIHFSWFRRTLSSGRENPKLPSGKSSSSDAELCTALSAPRGGADVVPCRAACSHLTTHAAAAAGARCAVVFQVSSPRSLRVAAGLPFFSSDGQVHGMANMCYDGNRLACMAFSTVFHRRQTGYEGPLAWLDGQLALPAVRAQRGVMRGVVSTES